MKYAITVVLRIYQTLEVEANSLEDAKQIGWKRVDQNQLLTDHVRGEGATTAEYEIDNVREW